jgi:ribosome recycling factor
MIEDHIKELETALGNIRDSFREDLRGVRSNRPSVQLVEEISVDAYGQKLTVKEIGSLALQPPRDIVITVWDQSLVPAVAKAIEEAKAGLSVSVGSSGGNTIRASLPMLSEERRREVERNVRKMAEEARIKIRGYRDESMRKLKAAEERKELSEDQAFQGKEKLQRVVDDANGRIEEFLNAKLKELE